MSTVLVLQHETTVQKLCFSSMPHVLARCHAVQQSSATWTTASLVIRNRVAEHVEEDGTEEFLGQAGWLPVACVGRRTGLVEDGGDAALFGETAEARPLRSPRHEVPRAARRTLQPDCT